MNTVPCFKLETKDASEYACNEVMQAMDAAPEANSYEFQVCFVLSSWNLTTKPIAVLGPKPVSSIGTLTNPLCF